MRQELVDLDLGWGYADTGRYGQPIRVVLRGCPVEAARRVGPILRQMARKVAEPVPRA